MLLDHYTKWGLSNLTPHSKKNKSYLTPNRVTLFDIFNVDIHGSNLIFSTIKLLKKKKKANYTLPP